MPKRERLVGAGVLSTVVVAILVSMVARPAWADSTMPGAHLTPYPGSVELSQERTRCSKTFQNTTGTRTWVASAGSIHYQDERSTWQEIDLGITPLASSSFDYGMTRNAYVSFFKADASARSMARFQTGNWSVTFGVEGGCRGPVVIHANQITYRDALPGADLRFTTNADDLREEIILHERPTVPVWLFELNLQGVRLEEGQVGATPLNPPARDWIPAFAGMTGGKAGTLDFVDIATGDRVWSMPKPFMVDGSGTYCESVSKKLLVREGRTFLRVEADGNWLASNERTYPVIVDPTFTSQPPQQDAYVSNKVGQEDTNYGGAGIALAINVTETGTSSVRRSLVAWDMTSAPLQDQVDNTATSVRVKLRGYSRNIDATHPDLAIGNVRLHWITSSWIETGTGSVTWNHMPTWTSASYITQTSVGTTVPTWYTWSYNGRTLGLPATGRGFLVKAAAEATGTGNGFAGVNFNSKDYTGGDPANCPILAIDYVPPCTSLVAPSAAAATNVTSCQIQWNWGENGNTCEAGYKVYSAASGGTPLTTVDGSTTTWLETGLTASTSYSRWVAAYWSTNESPRTALTPTSTTAVPAPTAAAASGITSSSIQWNWGQNSNDCEDGFKIYDAAVAGNLLQTVGANVTTWKEEGLSPETPYTRWVAAFRGTAQSARTQLGPVTTTTVRPCLLNAGFEEGFTSGVGNHWIKFTTTGNVTCASSTSSRTGTACQQVYSADNANAGGVYQQFNATVGQAYTVAVYIKTSNSSSIEGYLGVDAAGGTNFLTLPPGAVNGTNSTSWSKQDLTVTATATQITVFLWMHSVLAGVDGYAYFDDATPDCNVAPLPPSIIQQPTNQTVITGGTATFTVQAAGDPPLAYQWQKNGSNLSNGGHVSGATTTTLTIATADSGDQGNYRCVVTSPYGTATSNAASLTVTTGTAPTITQHPANQTVAAGSTATFTVQATGSPTLSYQWQKNGSNLSNGGRVSGALTATLTISTASSTDQGNYRCVVTNPYGSATSNAASLTVTGGLPPTITQHPTNQTVALGGTATFTVQVSGDPTLSYQWQKNSSNLSNGGHVAGATTTALQITNADTSDQGNYRCVVTNPYGSATSNAATLTVTTTNVPPSITQHPANQTVQVGGTAMFAVQATGTMPLAYQWQKNGANVADGSKFWGVNSASLLVNDIALEGDTGNFRCIVTNAYGSATSNSAALAVGGSGAVPTITQHPVDQQVCAGGSATFSVTATGSGTFIYQWQKNGINLVNGGHYAGVTTPVLTVANVDSSDVAGYLCLVGNASGVARTVTRNLSLSSAPAITQDPASQRAMSGATVAMTVTATGGGTLTYQWQKNGTNLSNGGRISGATSATLQITGLTPGDSGNYACTVTGCGTAASNAALLTVANAVPADFDADTDVDLDDFALLQVCLDKHNALDDPTCAITDLSGNGVVNEQDVTLFSGCISGADIAGNPSCAGG